MKTPRTENLHRPGSAGCGRSRIRRCPAFYRVRILLPRSSLEAWQPRTRPSIRTSSSTPPPSTLPPVTSGEETLGIASHVDDVAELLRLADLYVTDVESSDLVEWQGGGPEDWPGLHEHHEHHEHRGE